MSSMSFIEFHCISLNSAKISGRCQVLRSLNLWSFITFNSMTVIPVVPARGGAEVALKIYIRPFSSIELACAVRQPSPCVRALCETGVLFHMSAI